MYLHKIKDVERLIVRFELVLLSAEPSLSAGIHQSREFYVSERKGELAQNDHWPTVTVRLSCLRARMKFGHEGLVGVILLWVIFEYLIVKSQNLSIHKPTL